MKLTEIPDVIQWPESHYVYFELVGPFQETASKAWQALHANKEAIGKQSTITAYTSLYKIEPQMIYRAGVFVDKKPEVLPEGFQYTKFAGGKYSRFVLTGSYSNLPVAVGKVFEIVKKTELPLRNDFFLENYANNPETTPEDQLLTEILIPTK